jgi:pimeloyl-ACP methyl ester carboxylesterase
MAGTSIAASGSAIASWEIGVTDHNNAPATRQRLRLSGGTEVSFIKAGEPSKPAVLLLHGTPNSANLFRNVVPALAKEACVLAPDLPGCGQSEPLPAVSFAAIGQAISELLDRLEIGPRFIYLHDWGAPVGLHIAMQAPERVLGLIVQNANAHRTGWGPGWAATQAYWAHPTAENEAAATAHLSLQGTRDTYISGVPPDVAERIPAAHWEEDWRMMNLPGRMQTQRALIADYGHYAERFDDIAKYLAQWQPPALMVWGRHDIYFDIAEVLSWMRALPRMEAHVLDAGHLLLETHAAAAVSVMLDFIRDTQASRRARVDGGEP